MSKSKVQKQQTILGDHKRVGKKFIAPMVQAAAGGLQPASYFKDTLPEIIWLALTEDKNGMPVTAKICEEIGNFVRACGDEKLRLGTLSEFKQISPEMTSELVAYLETVGLLGPLQAAIHDLVVLYPNCPLGFIFKTKPSRLADDNFLEYFDNLVRDLSDKRGKPGIVMQANLIYLLGLQGKLLFGKESSLWNLEAIKDYPNTDESLQVGACICSASIAMIQMQCIPDDKADRWSTYFWQRSLELKPINIDHLKEQHHVRRIGRD